MLQRILNLLFRRRKPAIRSGNEDLLKNYALALAQEWGKDWLQPVQARLAKDYPTLTAQELDDLNSLAQSAMKDGHDLVYSMAEREGKKVGRARWQTQFSSRYPWVDEKNLSHLFSTGMYYAWKDGVGQNT